MQRPTHWAGPISSPAARAGSPVLKNQDRQQLKHGCSHQSTEIIFPMVILGADQEFFNGQIDHSGLLLVAISTPE